MSQNNRLRGIFRRTQSIILTKQGDSGLLACNRSYAIDGWIYKSMNIFTDYKSKDELLKDVATEILETQNDSGETVYRLQNRDADTYRAKFEAEVKNAKSQREKKQEAEARLAELTKENERNLVELNQLREMNPADLKSTLQKYVDQTAESSAKIKALEKELEPLRAANEAYKARETREIIEKELVATARKMNCSEPAMRDVKRLAPMFRVGEGGVVISNDGKLVAEVLQAELEQSPHWLKRSQGAGSNPGSAPLSNEAKFREALKGKSFADVLSNAPRQQVR